MKDPHKITIEYEPVPEDCTINFLEAMRTTVDINDNTHCEALQIAEVLTFCVMLISNLFSKLPEDEKQNRMEQVNLIISHALTDNGYSMGVEPTFMEMLHQNLMVYMSIVCQRSVSDLTEMSEDNRIALLQEKMDELREHLKETK